MYEVEAGKWVWGSLVMKGLQIWGTAGGERDEKLGNIQHYSSLPECRG